MKPGVTAQLKPAMGHLLRARSFREELVVQLQQDIIMGGFQPGQKIVERELIERFGVSSIPIREALQDLESRGLLTRKMNYGYSVVQLSDEETRSHCELRQWLEPKVVEWGAERITPGGVMEMEAAFRALESAARVQNISAFFHADLHFHRSIWNAAGNPNAARALESALGSLFASRPLWTTQKAAGAELGLILQKDLEKHRLLMEAVKAGDGSLAAAHVREIAAEAERIFQPGPVGRRSGDKR